MDAGQKYTDKILEYVERRINREYAQAEREIEAKMEDYFRRYKIKDETWQKWVEEGSRTEEEYKQWRMGQWAVGKRWSAQKDAIAHDLYRANERAKEIIKGEAPAIFADNFNFATYQVEHDSGVNTSFTLYNREAVERIIVDNPRMLPLGKKVSQEIAEGKAVRWNRQQLQSVMIQGILQGESIPDLATRLADTVGEKNRKAAIRNARTMATGAQNAGRVNAYKRAQGKGVDLEQMWLAVMDNRTRHTHRWLDGETRPVGEAFSNGCEYPADPKGDPAEIYNCRCTLRGVVKGLERRAYKYKDTSGLEGMSYDEWRKAKAKPQDILHQEKVGKAIKGANISKYKKHPNMPDTITHSPVDFLPFRSGSKDITKQWLSEAVPNSHDYEIVERFMQDGAVYDARVNSDVQIQTGEAELRMAELIKEKRGGVIKLLPTVSGDTKYVSTSDYLIDGERYDLKTMKKGFGKRAVQNTVSPHQDQAENFILDISNSVLPSDELIRQGEEMFRISAHASRVRTLVYVKNDEIIKVLRRK